MKTDLYIQQSSVSMMDDWERRCKLRASQWDLVKHSKLFLAPSGSDFTPAWARGHLHMDNCLCLTSFPHPVLGFRTFWRRYSGNTNTLVGNWRCAPRGALGGSFTSFEQSGGTDKETFSCLTWSSSGSLLSWGVVSSHGVTLFCLAWKHVLHVYQVCDMQLSLS